mmetsp:Transcript_16899/g.43008  ORF Transcript_16899/g.43008 Transcript_16899/m.43008 type:complete len:229 (-) Transcript_16899:1032-1718(-)
MIASVTRLPVLRRRHVLHCVNTASRTRSNKRNPTLGLVPMAVADAMQPPILVPQIKSNNSQAGRWHRASMTSSKIIGLIPLMPPPSMQRMRKGRMASWTAGVSSSGNATVASLVHRPMLGMLLSSLEVWVALRELARASGFCHVLAGVMTLRALRASLRSINRTANSEAVNWTSATPMTCASRSGDVVACNIKLSAVAQPKIKSKIDMAGKTCNSPVMMTGRASSKSN